MMTTPQGLPTILPTSEKLFEMGARLLLMLAVAFLFQRLAFLIISRFERLMARAAARHGANAESRARTLGQVIRSLVTLFVAGAALTYGLAVLGWDVKPLIAGAGILGVALGFGAQSLVRDWIAGVFILLENQYAVGDVIEVGGRAATVEEISVRSTTLRDFNGYVHFVPNGEMRVVVNRSRDWNRVAVDLSIHPGEDVERALTLCCEAATRISAEPEWAARIVEPVRLWGVESLAPGEAQIRMVIRARPGGDAAEVARELRRRVLAEFARAGIRYPLALPSSPGGAPEGPGGERPRTEPS